MSNEVFQLFTLTRSLAEYVELAEALGFPEISALAETERKRRLALGAKAKAILEDSDLSPAISLHRRRLVAEVELDSTDIVFEPPKRTPDWQEPNHTVRVHFMLRSNRIRTTRLCRRWAFMFSPRAPL